MALFTPYSKNPADPSYLGLSKEFDTPKTDTSAATFFAGITQIGDAAIKGLDELHKITINRELETKINAARDEDIETGKSMLFGPSQDTSQSPLEARTADSTTTPSDTTPQNASTEELPPGVVKSIRKMDKYAQANKLGRFDDIGYYSNMQTIVQETITQYPGYAPEIRKKAAEILGTQAANAQRAAIQDTLAKIYGKANETKNRDINDTEKWGKYLGEGGMKAALSAAGTPEFDKIRIYVAKQQASEHNVDLASKGLDLRLKSGKVDAEDKESTLNLAASNLVSRTMEGFTAGVGNFSGNYATIQKSIQDMVSSGGKPDPVKLQQLGLALGQIRDGFANAFDRMVMDPQFNKDDKGRPTGSFSSIMKNPQLIANIKQQYMSLFTTLEKQIGAGNLELATSTMNLIKNIKENNVIAAMAYPTVQRLQAVSDAVGGQAGAAIVNNWFTQGGFKDLSQLGADIAKLRTIQIYTDGDKNGGMDTSIKNYEAAAKAEGKNPTPSPKFLNNEIETVKHLATNKNLTQEQRNKAAAVITNNSTYDFLKALNIGERFNAWSRLADPVVVADRKKAGTEEWNKFRTWSETTFVRLFNEYIDTFNVHPQITNIRFNPESQQIEYDRLIGTKLYKFGEPTPPMVGANPAVVSANRLNMGFKALSNVLAADGQKITPEYLKSIGLNLEPKKEAGTALNTILEKIKDYTTTPTTPELFKQAPNKSSYSPPAKGSTNLKELLDNPEGLPAHYKGRQEVIKNTAETPVKNIQDADGNDLLIIKKDGVWHKIVVR